MKAGNLYSRFLEFDRANPRIWDLFKTFTGQAIVSMERGNGKIRGISADMICHRIRWHIEIDTDGDPFKLNNNYVAYYARKFVRLFPKYGGVFKFRSVRGDRERIMHDAANLGA